MCPLWMRNFFKDMACIDPIVLKTPETRWLAKCRKQNRSYEYYIDHANQKRNLQYDPAPLCNSPYEYYAPRLPVRYMKVPCGHCDGCDKARADKYFVRCWFEWKRTTLHLNGSAWFFTLTYGEEMLPHLDNGMPCFDKRHVQLFIKRLSKYSGLKFKYFYVTEFGGEFGRPHYHGILFIENFENSQSNQYRLMEYIAKAWTKIEDRREEYSSMSYLGLFEMQRVHVVNIDSSRLIRYCVKYICKQMGATEFDKYCEEHNIDKRFRRFHQASDFMGDCLVEFANVDCWDEGFVNVDGFKYSIPDYYRIKMMREHYFTFENGDYCYRPSDFALQYYENLSKRQFNEFKQLAILDKSFPRPPSWVYDMETILKVYDYIDIFNCFRETPPDIDIACLLDEWSEYLNEVQRYYSARYKASAKKWKDNLSKQYGKKIGLNC